MITTLTIDIDTAPKTMLVALADFSDDKNVLHELSKRNEWEVLYHLAHNEKVWYITLKNVAERVEELKFPKYIRSMIHAAILCNPTSNKRTVMKILEVYGQERIFVCFKGKHYNSLNALAEAVVKNA